MPLISRQPRSAKPRKRRRSSHGFALPEAKPRVDASDARLALYLRLRLARRVLLPGARRADLPRPLRPLTLAARLTAERLRVLLLRELLFAPVFLDPAFFAAVFLPPVFLAAAVFFAPAFFALGLFAGARVREPAAELVAAAAGGALVLD